MIATVGSVEFERQRALWSIRARLEEEVRRRAPGDIEAAKKRFLERNKFSQYFPDEGAFRRELYPRQVEFFAKGLEAKERALLGANRSGKTQAGAYEITAHATGLYPKWWPGKTFNRSGLHWACGTTSQTVRDIVQKALIGPPEAIGTGMIPGDRLIDGGNKPKRGGLADAVETILVRHISGKLSTIVLKSYEQGRKAFEGDAVLSIWDDEEPPMDCYTEQLMRLVTTKGRLIATFTMMQGYSDVVKLFLDPLKTGELIPSRAVIKLRWSDNPPHLDQEEKQIALAGIPPHQRAARTECEPYQEAGMVYPVAEEEIREAPFDIPATWRRCYALDVGWRVTAALWMAEDPETGILHVYKQYYGEQATPAVHAKAIKLNGAWIPGVIDPASRQRSPADGLKLMKTYIDAGLILRPSRNAVEAGIAQVWSLFSSGKLKVFDDLVDFWREFQNYHRKVTPSGEAKPVKEDDHTLDCLKYLVLSGRGVMRAFIQANPRGNAMPQGRLRGVWS